MSAIDLFLLGFFVEPAREIDERVKLPTRFSAYEIANFIGENELQEMIKISTPAVFKNLIAMAEKGYLVIETVRDGNFPEKKIYSITEKGRKYFRDLMKKISLSALKYRFDFNSFILNLDKITPGEAFNLLNVLKKEFEKKREFFQFIMKKYDFIPLTGRSIIRQSYMVNETMIKWITDFIEEYKNEVNL